MSKYDGVANCTVCGHEQPAKLQITCEECGGTMKSHRKNVDTHETPVPQQTYDTY